MNKTSSIGLATAVVCLATAGCFGLLPRKNQTSQDRQLSEQDKRELRAAGGDELITDMEQLLASAPKNDPILYCLDDYMVAAKHDKQEGKQHNHGAVMSRAQKCSARCGQSASGAYQSYAAKYGGRCKEMAAASGKAFHLDQAKLAMEALRKSEDPLDWYEGARGVKVELQRSKAGLGDNGREIDPMFAEYDKLVLAHRKEIDNAKAFLDRDDILNMQQQAQIMDEELRGLRRRYNQHHWESTADLIRVTQARRNAIDERYRREGIKAGVMKDRRP